MNADPNWRCQKCKQARGPDGHDPCISHLPGVNFACCGHGERDGYVSFKDGTAIYFRLREVIRNASEKQRKAMREEVELPRAVLTLPDGTEITAHREGNVISIWAASPDRKTLWFADNLGPDG